MATTSYFENSKLISTVKQEEENEKNKFNLKMSNEVKLEKELDCSNASRGVWLVKVPKYIARKWEKGKKIKKKSLNFVISINLFFHFQLQATLKLES